MYLANDSEYVCVCVCVCVPVGGTLLSNLQKWVMARGVLYIYIYIYIYVCVCVRVCV